VQQMVKLLLGLQKAPAPFDASDALAVAICHLHSARELEPGTRGPGLGTGGSRSGTRDPGPGTRGPKSGPGSRIPGPGSRIARSWRAYRPPSTG
jgi:hypothetical protein